MESVLYPLPPPTPPMERGRGRAGRGFNLSRLIAIELLPKLRILKYPLVTTWYAIIYIYPGTRTVSTVKNSFQYNLNLNLSFLQYS